MTCVPDRRKLHERVMGDVLAAILSGEYPIGSGLPREVDLAEKHDVSRYVARECIQALRDRGVLTVKHGRGTTIAPQDRWNLFDESLLAAMLGGPEGRGALAEARECRALIWPEVAALAAERRKTEDVGPLEAAVATGEDAFLRQLAATAGNRFLRHVLFSLDRATAGEAPARAADAPAPASESAAAVLAAVRDGDPAGAREAMRAHLA
jgi:GntR family transcriptional repressor for pyruvate dehydrogenase complex